MPCIPGSKSLALSWYVKDGKGAIEVGAPKLNGGAEIFEADNPLSIVAACMPGLLYSSNGMGESVLGYDDLNDPSGTANGGGTPVAYMSGGRGAAAEEATS